MIQNDLVNPPDHKRFVLRLAIQDYFTWLELLIESISFNQIILS